MRPYSIDTTRPHGGYLVPASPCGAQRPNRTAAGITAQIERKRRRHPLGASQPDNKLEGDLLTLAVRGTLDTLNGTRWRAERVKCDCCGHLTDKLRLRPGTPKSKQSVRRRFPRRPLP